MLVHTPVPLDKLATNIFSVFDSINVSMMCVGAIDFLFSSLFRIYLLIMIILQMLLMERSYINVRRAKEAAKEFPNTINYPLCVVRCVRVFRPFTVPKDLTFEHNRTLSPIVGRFTLVTQLISTSSRLVEFSHQTYRNWTQKKDLDKRLSDCCVRTNLFTHTHIQKWAFPLISLGWSRLSYSKPVAR